MDKIKELEKNFCDFEAQIDNLKSKIFDLQDKQNEPIKRLALEFQKEYPYYDCNDTIEEDYICRATFENDHIRVRFRHCDNSLAIPYFWITNKAAFAELQKTKKKKRVEQKRIKLLKELKELEELN